MLTGLQQPIQSRNFMQPAAFRNPGGSAMPNTPQVIVKGGSGYNEIKGTKTIKDDTIRNNLQGTSRFMSKKGWTDPQGRQGKGYGVYRFADKYGTNIDGYSPIYSPDEWTDAGANFKLGIPGAIAWLGVVALILGVGGTL